ncbi:carnitine O-palmitoyltransferase 2, mitochondrial [Neodiprion virginianus]|uniref:carnitine O-palmitoyltransferase 2, mitochondrial n=1 Tax=Neodiprion fabricii TaxID=2872261 RepID=UPI001ED901F4|nr:carnitine O-palmitoyltransferase 2, mitochondrial [Neodiprion fabricii]XP_046619110.1 carnitine O-palmitoyltransferase 2, mitochondrial [Neodiprion virginianus]
MSLLVAKRLKPIYVKINGCTILLPLQRPRSTQTAAQIRSKDDDDYEYIQKSILNTMRFQGGLPRLPIPELKKTCERYLSAQKPILIEEQFKHTESCVQRFLVGDGPKLQTGLKLTNFRKRHTSYITEYWFDMYLRDRKPLPINYNPFMVFTPERDPRYENQLVKSTNLLISSIRFMKSLRDRVLEPHVYHMFPEKTDNEKYRKVMRLVPSSLSFYGSMLLFKAFPLDMSQYDNLFHSTRIPELEKDMIQIDNTTRHVVVMRKGHFYTFNVLDENDHIYPPKEIASSLKFILSDDGDAARNPIGVLTTTERDSWAVTRHHLSEIGNYDLLKTIDSAIMLLVLDEESVATDYKKLLRTFLHGSGLNRWFDKSFSLIVAKDGTAGVNFEHSWGDGVAVLRYFEDVKKDIDEKPRFHPEDVDSISSNATVRKLSVISDNKIDAAIAEAKKQYNEWIQELGVDYYIYGGFGKKECKTFGVSPDAIMQLAFQLAHYKQEREMVATYESCSTAAFKHGRTETIRSCTLETKALCEAITNSSSIISNAELKKMIINCSVTHSRLTREAALGQGFDRHLFALNKAWKKAGIQKPAIFEDPSYETLNHNILSTSTLSSPAVAAGAFGPVVKNGYGIGYMIQDNRLGAVATSYQDQRNTSDYIQNLKSAIKDIHNIFLAK